MTMDTFLSHAQRLITNQLNAYIQDPADTDGVDATKVSNIGADGKLFKKVVGNSATSTDVYVDRFRAHTRYTDVIFAFHLTNALLFRQIIPVTFSRKFRPA